MQSCPGPLPGEDTVISELKSSAYLYALTQVRGMGYPDILETVKAFPSPDALANAPGTEIEQRLGQRLSQLLLLKLVDHWQSMWSSAAETIHEHVDRGIQPIPITDSKYPKLLKLIPDPPPILFVKGSADALTRPDAAAVVGTRNPTKAGKTVAQRVGRFLAVSGYTVVSGLAKGIDTSAHLGALESGGLTIAVLGTPLDKIYPAENRPLAERIIESRGALVTEKPLGHRTFKSDFVQRDRVQSGLSLAVIAVQTDIEGGTMHTVKFAEAQGRLLFCPTPMAAEQSRKQYRGIWHLLNSGKARGFQAGDYALIVRMLQDCKRQLLGLERPTTTASETEEVSPESERAWVLKQESQPTTLRREILDRLETAFREIVPDCGVDELKRIFSELRKRLFTARPQKSKKRPEKRPLSGTFSWKDD